MSKNLSLPRDSEHREWEARLDKVARGVDGWSARVASPEPIDQKSSLGADSLPGLDVAESVWYSMCVAWEHLAFAMGAMRATGTLYPSAYVTVARTALLAAVNAVWVLSPSSRLERRRRAIRLRADDLRNQRTAIEEFPAPDKEEESARDELLVLIADRQDTLQGAATAIGVVEDVRKMKMDQTQVMSRVEEHLRSADADGTMFLREMWRLASAAAHAQFHYGAARAELQGEAEQYGSAVAHFRGELSRDTGPAIAAAAFVLNEAFRLYDLRRVPH